jgi:hypothetical protein
MITLIPSLWKTSSKGPAELRVAVVDQESRIVERRSEAKIARLLSDPTPARMRGAAGELDPPALKLDEEQHVVAA